MNLFSYVLLLSPAIIAADGSGKVLSWSSLDVSLPEKLSDFAVASNPDNGLIYFAGGCSSTHGAKYDSKKGVYQCAFITDMLREFNPSTKSFRKIGNMPRPRYRHGMAFADNKLWVIGGRDVNDRAISEVDVFDFSLYRWVTPGDFPLGISDSGVSSNGNFVYIFGGYTQNYMAVRNVWRIHATDTNQVSISSVSTIPSPNGVADIQAVNDGVGSVIIAGGYSHVNCTALTGLYRYNYAGNGWNPEEYLQQGRAEMAAAFLEGHYLAIGGETEYDDMCFAVGPEEQTGIVRDTVETLDGTFIFDTPFPIPRFRAQALTVGNQIFVFGGQDEYDENCDCYPNTNEIIVGEFVDATVTGQIENEDTDGQA